MGLLYRKHRPIESFGANAGSLEDADPVASFGIGNSDGDGLGRGARVAFGVDEFVVVGVGGGDVGEEHTSSTEEITAGEGAEGSLFGGGDGGDGVAASVLVDNGRRGAVGQTFTIGGDGA